MNLQTYLDNLKSCPDHQLRSQYGIYDEFPILIKGPIEEIAGLFTASGKFIVDHDFYSFPSILPLGALYDGKCVGDGSAVLFSTAKEIAFETVPQERYRLVLFDKVCDYYTSRKESGQKERQQQDYNLTLLLCGKDSDIFEPSYPFLKKAAQTVIEVGEILLKHCLPACLPSSYPREKDPRDYSKIVYHLPQKTPSDPYPTLKHFLG